MSLEDAIKENTAAVRELIAALSKGAAPAPEAVAKPVKQKPKAEEQVAKQNEQAAKAELPKPAFLKGSASKFDAPEEAANDPVTVPYDDVKAAVLKYVKDGHRQKVVDVLGDYKVDRADQLKPEQYSEFLASLKKACA